MDIFEGFVNTVPLLTNGSSHHFESGNPAGADIAIFVVEVNFSICTKDTFEGACVDSGAAITIIEKRKAILYCKLINIPLNTKKLVGNLNTFKFGKSEHHSIGISKFVYHRLERNLPAC